MSVLAQGMGKVTIHQHIIYKRLIFVGCFFVSVYLRIRYCLKYNSYDTDICHTKITTKSLKYVHFKYLYVARIYTHSPTLSPSMTATKATAFRAGTSPLALPGPIFPFCSYSVISRTIIFRNHNRNRGEWESRHAHSTTACNRCIFTQCRSICV